MLKMPAFKYWRTIVPLAVFATIVKIFARHDFPLPDDIAVLLWWTRLDPLLLLSFLRFELAFPVWGWVPVLVILFTILFGRFFCGWLCPMGGVFALAESIKGKNKSLPQWAEFLKEYRFYWLFFLLALMMLGSGWTMFLSPFHLLTAELTRIWRGEFPWLLNAIILLAFLLLPRFWCLFICPTGLLLSFFSKWRIYSPKAPESCSDCKICEKVCPTWAALPYPESCGQDCLMCGRCSERCPAGSFELSRNIFKQNSFDGNHFSRREFFRGTVAVAAAGTTFATGLPAAKTNPLRPPGSLEELEFLARCSRCGRCIKTCVSKCLHPMPLSSGWASYLTPEIIPLKARCELTLDCQRVCPTGAISHLPVEKVIIGIAKIDETRCLGWVEDKLCIICEEQCPVHAVVSDEDGLRPTILEDVCVGCGACENVCPVENPRAVVIIPQKRRRRD